MVCITSTSEGGDWCWRVLHKSTEKWINDMYVAICHGNSVSLFMVHTLWSRVAGLFTGAGWFYRSREKWIIDILTCINYYASQKVLTWLYLNTQTSHSVKILFCYTVHTSRSCAAGLFTFLLELNTGTGGFYKSREKDNYMQAKNILTPQMWLIYSRIPQTSHSVIIQSRYTVHTSCSCAAGLFADAGE